MNTYQNLLVEIIAPLAYVTLNRPEQHNTLTAPMIDELIDAFTSLRERTDVTTIILSGAGGTFCAGDSLYSADSQSAESDDAAALLSALLTTISEAPQVVVARIDGAAQGAGFGLVCVSDIAIASTTTVFSIPDVRVGRVPTAIAPFVVQRIGLTRARLLTLTGVTFDGVSAHEYGLVHEVCPAEILDDCTGAILAELRPADPAALRETKQLLSRFGGALRNTGA